MKMLWNLAFLIAQLFISVASAQAVVTDTDIAFMYDSQIPRATAPGYEIVVPVRQAPGNYSALWFTYQRGTFGSTNTLTPVEYTVDGRADFYFVPKSLWRSILSGTQVEFSNATIAAGGFQSLEPNVTSPADNAIQFSFPVHTPSVFFVGIASSNNVLGPRDNFGWLELQDDGLGNLSMVSNSIAYGASGIYLGTSIVASPVPEPQTGAMFLVGLMACGATVVWKRHGAQIGTFH